MSASRVHIGWVAWLRSAKGLRRVRRIRRTVYALAALWFAYFAYARWTALPAAIARGEANGETEAVQQMRGLADVLVRLPAFSSPSAGNAGWRGLSGLRDASRGPWAPDERAVLGDIVAHITAKDVNRVLDDLRSFTELHPEIDITALLYSGSQLGDLVSGRDLLAEIAEAANALTARARYWHAEHDDPLAASADLVSASRLGRVQARLQPQFDRWWGYQRTIGHVPLIEWSCLLRERDLPPELARELIAFFTDELTLSVSQAFGETASMPADVDAFLDRYYTDNGHGDGWLVVSHAAPIIVRNAFSYSDSSTGTRSGFWNLSSPAFDGRARSRAALTRWHTVVLGLDDQVFQAGLMSIRTIENARISYGDPSATPMGPTAMILRGLRCDLFTQVAGEVMRRRAVVVMLALAAHHSEHGAYPSTLDELVPEYLAQVPLDAHTLEPFKYELRTDGDYELAPAHSLRSALDPDYQTQFGTPEGCRRYSLDRPAPAYD